jgi:hypothetical protein
MQAIAINPISVLLRIMNESSYNSMYISELYNPRSFAKEQRSKGAYHVSMHGQPDVTDWLRIKQSIKAMLIIVG